MKLLYPFFTVCAFACSLASSFSQNNSFLPCSNCLSGLPGSISQSAFGDYDNDGDLDLLAGGLGSYTGGAPSGKQSSFTYLYTNNGSGTFTHNTAVTITGMNAGEISWSDYDRDGYLDFAVSGLYTYLSSVSNTKTPYLLVYHNLGNGTFGAPITLTGMAYGGLDWGDYDGDGDQDLFSTGASGNYSSSTVYGMLYRNDGNGIFSSITTTLPAVNLGNVKWCDYDRDGDQDAAICGQTTAGSMNKNTSLMRIYRNDGDGNFTDIQAGFQGLTYAYLTWADFDNDGYSDLAMQGYGSTSGYLTRIYRNQQDGTFADMGLGLDANYQGNLVAIDLNGDGKTDLVSSGKNETKIYLQNSSGQFSISETLGNESPVSIGDCNGNQKPDIVAYYGNTTLSLNQYPNTTTLPAVPDGIRTEPFGSGALLYWNAVSTDQSGPGGISYNVRLGTSSHAVNTISPMSMPSTGFRQVVHEGNAGHTNSFVLRNLTAGTYYWSVQAQNAAGQASGFSTEGSFTLPASGNFVQIRNTGADTICPGAGTLLQALAYPTPTAYQWYLNNRVISGANARSYTAVQPGTYKVVATTTAQGNLTSDDLILYASPGIAAPQVTNAAACTGQSVTLHAVPGAGGDNCKWYDMNSQYLGAGVTFTPDPAPEITTFYKVYSYSSATGCNSQQNTVVTATIYPLPGPPTAQGQQACAPQAFVLTATPAAGAQTCNWYAHSKRDTALAQSLTYNTGVVSGTKTWYATSYDTISRCESATRTPVVTSVDQVAQPVVTDAVLCVPGTAVLNASIGNDATTCYWYVHPADTVPVYTGTSLTLNNQSRDTTFYVSAYHATDHCESVLRTAATVTVGPDIAPPDTWDQQRYGSAAVTLEAWPGANATTCRWYSSAAKTTLLATGKIYTTPVLTQSTTYYVSSYDDIHGCEGADAVAVQAQILPVPAVTVNPDQVYPIPNLYGSDSYKNVNLFTGDVNLTFNLFEADGTFLKYSLNAFYNSRSAGITPLYTQNQLGGLGWKLMDYPKIVQDATTATYYLLDGMQAYPLTQTIQNDTIIQFAAAGNYHLWSVTMRNVQQPTGNRTWTLLSEDGTRYLFRTPAVGHLDNNQPGYRWDLSSISEAQGRDSISFTYQNGNLQQIQTSDLENWTFTYDNQGRIVSIEEITKAVTSGTQYPQVKTLISYDSIFPGTSYTQLSAVSYLQNVAPPPYTQAQYQQAAPAVRFSYNRSNFPGALKTMQAAQGGVVEYEYATWPWKGRQYQPVKGINTFSGTSFTMNNQAQYQYSPVALQYATPKTSADQLYLHFNQCEVIPGGNLLYKDIGGQSTSFESSKRDAVFKDLDPDYVSDAYALTGTKSYFFDGVALDNVIHSKRFDLHRKNFDAISAVPVGTPVSMSGSPDSVRIAFYVFDTHSTLNVRLVWLVNFYDAQNKKISDIVWIPQTIEIDDDNYGNWVPVEIVQGIPANAVSFDFTLSGGSATLGHYDFYMDELSITGSQTTLNGTIIYHYFNGDDVSKLAHLPGDYVTPYPDQQIRSFYKTGFEPGENYSNWLNLDHSSSCQPQATLSDASRQIAWNGSAALSLKACDDNYAKVYPKSEINIPSGTDRVLLSFSYSTPQFSGMRFKVESNVGHTSWDTTITMDGSYYIDPKYTRFYKWFEVSNTSDDFGFTIRAKDAGGGKNLNEFFIDDLRVVFIDKDRAPDLPPPPVTSSQYLGGPYHTATRTQDNHEIESRESFWIAGTDALAANTPLTLLYRDVNVQQGVAEDYKSYTWAADGRMASQHTTRDLEMPDGTYQQVLYLDNYVYADSLYPALGRSGLHLLNATAATVGSYSLNNGSSWSLYHAQLSSWSAMAPPAVAGAAAAQSVWVSSGTYLPKTQLSLHSVYSAVGQLPARAPASSQWSLANQVMAIGAGGQPVQTRAADSLITWQLFGAPTFEDDWHKTWQRKPVSVATFSDATPQNSIYFGFENYETPPPAAQYASSNAYSFTGSQSCLGSFHFNMPFHPGETPGSNYLVAFHYLAGTGQAKLTVSGNTGSIFTQTYTPGSTVNKQWQFVQKIITIPAGLTQLNVQLDGVGNNSVYFDDVRVLPATSTFSETGYDPEDYSIRSVLDNNGADMRFLYNWKGAQYATIGPGKVPQLFETQYLSRMAPTGNDRYHPLAPNNAFHITAREGGHYFAFNDNQDRSNWNMSSTTAVQFGAGTLNMSRTNTAAIPVVYNPSDYSNFGIAYQLLPVCGGSSATLEGGVSVGNYKFTTRLVRSNNQDQITLSLANGSSPVSIGTLTFNTTLSNPAYNLIVIFQANHVHVWFNDQYISNTFQYTAVNGTPAVSLFFNQVSGSSTMTFKDIALFNAPEIRADFTDGLDNNLQNQSVSGNNLVVQETQYDLMFRPVLQTKKVLLNNTWPGFTAGFISSFNWESGEMLGLVQQAKNYVSGGDADQKFMYWRSIWNPSPKTQIKLLYNPGYDFALRKQTNVEKAERWAYTHEQQIFEAIKYSLDVVQIIADPESAPVVIGMDVAGIIRKHFTHTTDNAQQEQAITNKYYDPFQRQTMIKLPLASADKHPKPDHVLNYSYEFNGNMTGRTAPESDTTRYVYDELGRLRFSQDADQAGKNLATYVKYDRWSRPVETGVFSCTWNRTTLATQAENPAYPNSGTTLQSTFSYDGTEGTNGYLSPNRGKRTHEISYLNNVQTNSLNSYYDINGNLVQTTQSIAGSVNPGSYTTQYHYDADGNIKLIQYPLWNNYRFQVRYAYDYLGNMSHIGDSTAVDRYATYEWSPDGKLYHEKLMQTNGVALPAWHWNNAPGWPDFSGFGDTVRTTEIKYTWWGSLWPQINYSFSLYSLDLDYNLLTDWWSDLWGQSYYNGNLASSTYEPGPLNVTKELKQGYLYNDYGNLESYYSNYQYDHFFDSGIINRDIRDTLVFDMNGNLVLRKLNRELGKLVSGEQQVAGVSYQYKISDTRNRPTRMSYTEYSNQSWFNHYRYDTLQMGYTNNGNINYLQWKHRNATTEKGQPGSVQFQYWKRFMWDDAGRLTYATYRNTNSDSTISNFMYDARGMRVQKTTKWYRGFNLPHTRSTTYFRNTNGDPMMEIIHGGTRDTVKYYIWGPDGIAVMYMNDGQSTHSWFVLKDNQGSARQLVDRADRSVDEYYATDEYGALLQDNTLYNGLFNYIYTSQEYDPETALHYFRARMYDPFSKMFLSPDPAGSNPGTPYAFVGNNPVNNTDPTGEIPFDAIFDASEDEITAAEREFAGTSTTQLMNMLPTTENAIGGHNRSAMIEFRRRFNDVRIRPAEFDDILNRNHTKMKSILRPGGKHEMLPVASWHQLRRLGIKLDDIQKFTHFTDQTFFQVIDPLRGGEWLMNPIPHGRSYHYQRTSEFGVGLVEAGYGETYNTIGSGKAHNELFTLINYATETGTSRQQFLDLIQNWMQGAEWGAQYTRVHENSIGLWMQKLQLIR